MPRTSWNELKNFRVFKPSSEAEQSRIAAVLDTVDEATAKTEAVIAKLRQVRAGLLHDLLTRGLDEHGQPRDPIAHPEQFKDSPLGRIPREWEVMPIQQAALDTPGATVIGPFGSNLLADDYRSKGVPVVFVRDIKADTFQWNSGVYIEPQKARELSAHSVEPGDQRATKMGLPPCIACPYPEWMPPGIVTADIIRLRPDLRKTTARWLSILVNSDAVARQVRAITGGVTRPKVTLPDFRTLTIALPSLQEQQGIVSILDFHDTRIRAEETHRNKLEAIKRGLMHDLLTGRVRVPA
ncbi:MAG: restriction endonuclease subunit S [Deltaproteobacteria bacterium]|nr:restriction endonuclease subunit S [Deltaproteobacteria bacterium]